MIKQNKDMMNEDERKVRKKSKRKKKPDKVDDEMMLEVERVMPETDESRDNSRNTSRSRRPLSSLFKRSDDAKQRSRSRSESRDKHKSKKRAAQNRDAVGAEASVTSVDPRTDPREHFKRMTVREALKDSRARGRSPGRPIVRLERNVLSHSSDTDTHRDSLATSLPQLADISSNTQNDNIEPPIEQVFTSTLPRTKRHQRRGYSADTNTQKRKKYENRDTIFPENLPLDKRKYMIDKDKANNTNQENSGGNSDTVQSHSISQETTVPFNVPPNFIQQEKSRRQSLSQFLQLRDVIPNRYSSSTLPTGKESGPEEYAPLSQSENDINPKPIVGDSSKVVLPTYEEAIKENIATKSVNNSNKSVINSAGNIADQNATTERKLSLPLKETDVNTRSKSSDEKHSLIRNDSVQSVKINNSGLRLNKNDSQIDTVNTNNAPCASNPSVSSVGETFTTGQSIGSNNNDRHDSIKTSYVSPRKFSRTSKASIKSDTSQVSDSPQEIASPHIEFSFENETTQQQKPSIKQKYQRHFSRKKSVQNKTKREPELNTETIETQNTTTSEGPHVEHSHSDDITPLTSSNTTEATQTESDSKEQIDPIQIGSKTYIAAVSAFKALLGRKLNEPGKTKNDQSNSLPETNSVSKTTNDDVQTTEKPVNTNSLCVNDCEQETNIVRPKFTLTSDKELISSNDQAESNVITLSDDEVFDIVQEDHIYKNVENKSENCNTHLDKSLTDNLLHHNSLSLPNKSLSQATTPEIQLKEDQGHFRRISDQSTESEENERRCSLPIISDGVIKQAHSLFPDEVKTVKASSEVNISEQKDTQSSEQVKSKDNEVETVETSKKGKSVKHRKKKVKGKSKRKSKSESEKQQTNESNDTAVKGILKKKSNDKTKKEDEKREHIVSKDKIKKDRKQSEKVKLVKQRSTSLTDISRATKEDKHVKQPRKSKSSGHLRSRSHDDISKAGSSIPEKADLKKGRLSRSKAIEETPSSAADKPRPRLSISAVIALKRLVRLRKAKHKAIENRVEDQEETSQTEEKVDGNIGDQTDESSKILLENELNTSLGKLTVLSENEIIDDELDSIYKRKIKFDPYCTDDISEEELIKQRQRNTRLTSRRESKVRQRQKKVISCCKKFIAFLFSHIGLCSLVVGYSIAGGFIFKDLEGTHEIEKNIEMEQLRENILQNIWDLAFAVKITKGSREVFRLEVDEILKNYSQRIQRETKESGWDGKDGKDGKEPKLWSFPSSLLFAITVMTTIGKYIYNVTL